MEERTVGISVINKILIGAFMLVFPVIFSTGYGLFGFFLGICFGTLLFALPSYRQITYDREKLVVKTFLRRREIKFSEVVGINYQNNFQYENGKSITIVSSLMYDQDQMRDMLDLVRSVLGKQDAYIVVQHKRYNGIPELTSGKSWREFQRYMREIEAEYDKIPVNFNPHASVVSSLATRS